MSYTNYSVRFNNIELNQYIDVLQEFSPLSGVLWEPDLLGLETITKGAIFSFTTYKYRLIPMPFTILGNLQTNYDALQTALRVSEPTRLEFEDLPGRIFYAVPYMDMEFEEEGPLGTGVINWLIPDGVSYSAVEKRFIAEENNGVWEVEIDNQGTEDASIDFNVTIGNRSGFLGIVSDNGVLQFGNPEELDREQYQRNEILVSGTPAIIRDTGINRENPASTTQGTMSLQALPGTFGNLNFLRLATRGLATANVWNGAMTTWQIPADSMSVRGSRNFRVLTQHRFETVDLVTQTGAQSMAFLNAQNQVICAVNINKGNASANIAAIDFWGPNRRHLRQILFQPSMFAEPCIRNVVRNPFNLLRGGRMEILKQGQTVTFIFDNQRLSFNIPEIANMECHQIQFWVGQHGGRNIIQGGLATGGREYLGWNHIRLNAFDKQNVQRVRDVPNRFLSNSSFFIDGAERNVYVNGMLRTEDESTGAVYFKAPPGKTRVQFMTSSFSEIASASANIREVFL